MKQLYLSLFLLVGTLLTSCGDDDKQRDPAPANTYHVALRLTQNGQKNATAFLRHTSLRDNTLAMLHQQNIDAGTVTVPAGSYQKGEKLVISIMYDAGGQPTYVRPTAGQFIQAEILVNGQPRATVRLDAASFEQPGNYWQETNGGNGRNLLAEADLTL